MTTDSTRPWSRALRNSEKLGCSCPPCCAPWNTVNRRMTMRPITIQRARFMPARPLYTEPERRCGASDAGEHGDVGQVAVKPVVVEAVAHDEHVGNPESDVVDPDVHLPPAALVQEHARAHA